MVKEFNLVVEEQGGFRRDRGCRGQIVSLILLGQTKVGSQEDCFWLPSLISVRFMTEYVGRSCGVLERVLCEGKVPSNAPGLVP